MTCGNFSRAFVWVVLLIFCQSSTALIHGVEDDAIKVSTVKIRFQHEHYLRSLGKWQNYQSLCSAVVVGVKPLTLLTAAHCLKEIKLAEKTGLPLIEILHLDQLGIQTPHLIQAHYSAYEDVKNDVAQDIAVLVFDAHVGKAIKPVKVHTHPLESSQSLLICGYGGADQVLDSAKPTCAERDILNRLTDFESVLPSSYQLEDEMLYLKSQAQFEYTKELIENEDTLVAINRLNKQNRYATELAIATIGDSGGAWLKKVGLGYELVAITSLVERFYNKSLHWNFFDKETPLLDYPYIAYGLRLGHPRVKNFLLYARNSGADITLD